MATILLFIMFACLFAGVFLARVCKDSYQEYQTLRVWHQRGEVRIDDVETVGKRTYYQFLAAFFLIGTAIVLAVVISGIE